MTLFEFVKSQILINNVVSEYVRLKPAGNYLKGSCPFHAEKDASFTVSPDKQIFYCFGCHAGGDVISFISKIENLSQIESAQHLVDRYNLDVPESLKQGSFKDFKKSASEKEMWFKACSAIANWNNQQLLKSNSAMQYLNNRNITTEEIDLFKIGYLPGGLKYINLLLKNMVKEGILLKDLANVGFLTLGKSTVYSQFEERIIFPIKDTLGRYVGFGGRIFQKNDTRAKYYNSKDGAFFSKGKLLFSLDIAKKHIQKENSAYLVEGYTDCVAMFKHNYKNCVATLGTACTTDHIRLLSRYTDNLTALYDGDKAGQKAIMKMAQLCWESDIDMKVVVLPKDEDPASFLNSDKYKQNLLDQSINVFSFFINSLGKDLKSKSLSERLKSSKQIVNAISNIKNRFKQDLLLQEAAEVTKIPFLSLKNLMLQLKQENSEETFNVNGYKRRINNINDEIVKYENPADLEGFNQISNLEEKIFSVIINGLTQGKHLVINPDLLPYFNEKIRFLINRLKETAENCKTTECLRLFIDNLDNPYKKWVLRVSLKFESNVSDIFFEQLIFLFHKSHWKQITRSIKIRITEAKENKDQYKLQDLLENFSKLKQEMQQRGLI